MNVARKSTTKLPQKWVQDQKLKSSEEEADSGVASADSTDSFQDAIFNLKALSGSGDMADSDRSEVQEAQSTSCTEKVKNGADHDEASESKGNAEDKDILEQIDNLVNVKDSLKAESTKSAVLKGEQGSEEEDDILFIKDDESKESSKESNGVPDSKPRNMPPKNPQKIIGEKVRSTVHSIMSRLVQSNPDVNNLLSKNKSEDAADSGDPSGASQVPLRQSKGNLFDNFEVSEVDSKSSDSKSPQQSTLDKEDKMVLRDAALEGSKNGGEQKDCITEKTLVDSTTEEPLASDPVHENTSLESHSKDSVEEEIKPASPIESNSSEVTVEKKCDSVNKFDNSPQNDPVLESAVDKGRGDCGIEEINSAKSESEEKPLPRDSSSVEPTESKADADDSKPESMETADSLPCDNLLSDVSESDPAADKNSATDRKRPVENTAVDEDDSQPPKRSRLDEVIGKLGERVTFPSDVSGIDLDDYEDSPLGDAESVEFKQLEEVSGSTTDEEEYKPTPEPKSQTITMTREELETLLTKSAKKAVEQYQSPEVSALNKRIQELQDSQEEWRQKAKNLERQVLDLTVLQQRLEKRKAHTAALKSITTRSIGIWVTEDKFLKSLTPQKPGGNKTPPATPPVAAVGHPAWTPNTQSPVRSLSTEGSNLSSVTNNVVNMTVSAPRNPSVAHLLSQTARMPTVASCAAANRSLTVGRPVMTGSRLSGPTTTPAGSQGASSATVLASASSGIAPVSNLVVVNQPAGKTVQKQPVGTTSVVSPAQVKVIDLTVEDDSGALKQGPKVVGGVRAMAPQQVVRQITPITQSVTGVPSSAILFSSPAGTQIVNSNNIQRPGMLQVVTIANAPNLRPGSIFTVMGGQAGNVRTSATAATLTTNARDSAPLVMTQQLPGGVTFLRPPSSMIGNNAGVRPGLTTLTAGGTSVLSASRTPVALATAQPQTGVALVQPDGSSQSSTTYPGRKTHPAPLPDTICPRGLPSDLKPPPPSPGLKISRVKQGIVLSWNMPIPSDCVEIASYQLFAYQETTAVPQTSLWKKVGDVKALPLPMACTLTQFQDGNKYHFAVRAIDVHGRSGPFSEPSYIFLTKAA